MTENTNAPTPPVATTTAGTLGPELLRQISERAWAEPPGYDEGKVLGMMSRMQDGEWRFDPAPLVMTPPATVEVTFHVLP